MAKRKIEAVKIDDLNVSIETKEIQRNTNIGRPKKFNKKLTKPINIYFSDGQVEAIDKKVAEWQGTDMSKFIRPQTLFGTKFDGYLNQEVKNSRLKYTGSKDYENLGW